MANLISPHGSGEWRSTFLPLFVPRTHGSKFAITLQVPLRAAPPIQTVLVDEVPASLRPHKARL